MDSPSSESTPLLRRSTSYPIPPTRTSGRDSGPNNLFPSRSAKTDEYTQFCLLAGIPPSTLPPGGKWPKPPRSSIYQRAKRKEASQQRIYVFTASLTNTLLLSQIIIGAALTALGASGSSSLLVAIFGALNTVIAGLVTYLKSRGQPMRARMFRDDLERVVDQIENSETMWFGISRGMHGYDEIDTDDEVSVRSEVARLTRLYDKAVRNNTWNNPDMYLNGAGGMGSGGAEGGLRARPGPAAPAAGDAAPIDVGTGTGGTVAVPAAGAAPGKDEDDESPATKAKVDETPPPAAPAPASAPAAPAKEESKSPAASAPAPASAEPSKAESSEPATTPAPAPAPAPAKPGRVDLFKPPTTPGE